MNPNYSYGEKVSSEVFQKWDKTKVPKNAFKGYAKTLLAGKNLKTIKNPFYGNLEACKRKCMTIKTIKCKSIMIGQISGTCYLQTKNSGDFESGNYNYYELQEKVEVKTRNETKMEYPDKDNQEPVPVSAFAEKGRAFRIMKSP